MKKYRGLFDAIVDYLKNDLARALIDWHNKLPHYLQEQQYDTTKRR